MEYAETHAEFVNTWIWAFQWFPAVTGHFPGFQGKTPAENGIRLGLQFC
jgi:hypothetical protein